MIFTIYKKEYYEVGDFIKILPQNYKKLNIYTKIDEDMLFGVVTKIRDNNSVEGKLINGIVEYSAPSFKNLVGPYSTVNETHFMWTDNELSDIDIKQKYPELLLQG